MLRRDRVSLALALATTVAVGCGSSGNNSGSGGQGGSPSSSSTAESSSSSSSSSSVSSSSSGGITCPTMEGPVYAGTKLMFGEGPNGQWKKVGINIDGLTSTGASKDVCQPNSMGSPGTAYPDGDNGIDNSFGKNLLPQILALYPTWTQDVNASIQKGNFTVLLKMYCMPPKGDAVFATKLFGGETLGMMPKQDGTDKWPVTPELLSDPMDPESSTIIFDTSSVTGTMYDSGKDRTFILTVPVSSPMGKSTSIKLTLHAAQATMTFSADRKSATMGTLSGVLNTEELVAEVKKIGDLLGLCNSPLLTNLITQVRQASDIMSDGTQDPSQTCDGISMGLNFEMTEALLGPVGMPQNVGMACP
ncbi:MAG: hypothetical protein QM820_39930 [Minicystis sp.]